MIAAARDPHARAPQALIGKGLAALEKLELKDAEDFAKRALAGNPRLPAALQLAADMHLASGEFADAARRLNEAKAVNPRDEATLGKLAACHYLSKQKAELDALCAAAEAVVAVERLASGGGVGTTGRLEVFPGAANVVPGKAEMWAEFRSIDGAWLDERHRSFTQVAAEAGARRGVAARVSALSRTEPVTTSAEIRDAMTAAIDGLGLEFRVLPSGAGHDTVQMARLGRVGMIFVPSAGGRSHCPDEWTAPEHVEAGASALLATILALDSR